jgi:hypothetical protein
LSAVENSDEFYDKLVQLKNEQKKTLLAMEDLYNQKCHQQQSISPAIIDLNNESRDYNQRQSVVSSKPPPPPDHRLTRQKLEGLTQELGQIEQMWQNFDLNDYDRTNFFDKVNEKMSKSLKSVYEDEFIKENQEIMNIKENNEWRPRVTIPRPFSMTLRQEKKKADQKLEKESRLMKEKREREIEAELKETERQFKARPVPAHIVLPLYEQKMMEEEARKISLKEKGKEYLDKVVKPFHLTDNNSNTNNKNRRSVSFSEGEKNTDFIAQPMPNFYHNEDIIKEKFVYFHFYYDLELFFF